MNKTRIKVMSFNLRYPCPHDGDNHFFARKERALAMLRREAPDVIGFQEVLPEMAAFLSESLPGYTLLFCGREADFAGESAVVAYRTDLFSLLSYECFWLSPTPNEPGSRYPEDQSVCPRVGALLRLVCRGGEPFCLLNTHLDHAGAVARLRGMQENLARLAAHPGLFIYTGDMNATPASPEIELALRELGPRGGRDVAAGLGQTFHAFGHALDDPDVRPEDWKIDYIFTNAPAQNVYLVPDEGKDGLYYSDHYAVVATLEV